MDGARWIYTLLALGTAPPLVPNSAAIASAGALAAQGQLSLTALFLVVAASAVAGDAIVYGAGHLARRRTLRWLARSRRRAQVMDWIAGRIHRHGVPFVIAIRFLPSGRVVGGLTAALVRYPVRRYLLGATVAEVIWASYTIGLGYWGGAALENTWSALVIGPGVSLLVAATAQLISARARRRAGGPVTPPRPEQPESGADPEPARCLALAGCTPSR